MPKMCNKTTFYFFVFRGNEPLGQAFVAAAFEIEEMNHLCQNRSKSQKFNIFGNTVHYNHITHDSNADICNLSVASFILNQFLLYLLIESPTLIEKQTFSAEEGAEKLELYKKESRDFFDEDSLYFNHLGVWMLKPTFSFKKLFNFS